MQVLITQASCSFPYKLTNGSSDLFLMSYQVVAPGYTDGDQNHMYLALKNILHVVKPGDERLRPDPYQCSLRPVRTGAPAPAFSATKRQIADRI